LVVLNIKPIYLELKIMPSATQSGRRNQEGNERLTNLGVFNHSAALEWAVPTFIQPKKTGDV
jgi:hypothetical protein